MGGHQSTQKVAEVVNIVGTAVQKITQNCVTYENAGNTVNIDGMGNIVDQVNQSMTIKVDSSCMGQVTQDASFEDKIKSQISQMLSDQEVALTQWMDNSKDDSEADIAESISTNVTSTTVQSCVNDINSKNILNITGSGNVVAKIVQDSTSDMISKCLLGQGQTSTAVNNITNAINQHSKYTSKNPLAFITDAIQAMTKSTLILIAVIFIVLVCFVSLFLLLRRKNKKPSAAQASAADAASGFEAPANLY
jgi:hypothetical protein